MEIESPEQSGTLELTCQRCGSVYLYELPFTQERPPICQRCFLIDGESEMTYKRLDGDKLTIKYEQHPTKADLRFICKEAILIAGAAAICAVHLWQRQSGWLSLLFGVTCAAFLAVAFIAGFRHWVRP